jgi:hypothetical protein
MTVAGLTNSITWRQPGQSRWILEEMAERKERSRAAPKSFRELTQGLTVSEGVWRLSVVLGFLGLGVWLVFWLYFVGTQIGFSNFANGMWNWLPPASSTTNYRGNPGMFLLIVGFSGVGAAIVPWGVVQVIGWVIEGFRRPSN